MRHATRAALLLCAAGLAAACGAVPVADVASQPQMRSAALPQTQCDFAGTWAIHFVIPVQWSGNMGVRPGSGTIVQHLRSNRSVDGKVVSDALQLCGSEVPDYRTTVLAGSELFGVRFPDALFDQNSLPGATLHATLSDLAPGATYETETIAIELGVALHDPHADPWPRSFTGLKQVLDADNDGNPGITVHFAQDEGYALPPTNFSRSSRAVQIFTAVRNVASSRGQVVSCDRFVGSAFIPHIGGSYAVNAHALGCVKEDGSHCSHAETSMLDKYEPTYAPHGEAKVVMQRIDANATCADVRAMAL